MPKNIATSLQIPNFQPIEGWRYHIFVRPLTAADFPAGTTTPTLRTEVDLESFYYCPEALGFKDGYDATIQTFKPAGTSGNVSRVVRHDFKEATWTATELKGDFFREKVIFERFKDPKTGVLADVEIIVFRDVELASNSMKVLMLHAYGPLINKDHLAFKGNDSEMQSVNLAFHPNYIPEYDYITIDSTHPLHPLAQAFVTGDNLITSGALQNTATGCTITTPTTTTK